MGVASVTGEQHELATCLLGGFGINNNCSDLPGIVNAVVNLNSVKTSPTLGDYLELGLGHGEGTSSVPRSEVEQVLGQQVGPEEQGSLASRRRSRRRRRGGCGPPPRVWCTSLGSWCSKSSASKTRPSRSRTSACCGELKMAPSSSTAASDPRASRCSASSPSAPTFIRARGRAEPTRDWPAFAWSPSSPNRRARPNRAARPRQRSRSPRGSHSTDVLLSGSAHARAPVECVETGLQVGRARKAVRVFGDRRLVRAPSGALGSRCRSPSCGCPSSGILPTAERDVAAEAEAVRELAEPFAKLGIPTGSEDALPCSLTRETRRVEATSSGPITDASIGTLAPNLDDASDPSRRTDSWLRSAGVADLPRPPATSPSTPDLPSVGIRSSTHSSPPRAVHELALGALMPEDLRERDSGAAATRASTTPPPPASPSAVSKARSASACGTCTPSTSCWSSTSRTIARASSSNRPASRRASSSRSCRPC